MKAIFLILFSVILTGMSLNAQDTMYIHQKNGLIIKIEINNIDSIVFHSNVVPINNGELITYSNIKLGGGKSIYSSFLDLETGLSYNYASTTTEPVKSTIDLIYDSSTLWTSGVAINSTGTKFASTSMTSTAFDALIDDSEVNFTASLTSITIQAEQVLFFITKGGKRGYLKVVSLDTAKDETVISIKIQK